MTIPWMMNCPHDDEGWCLPCASELGEEMSKYRRELYNVHQGLLTIVQPWVGVRADIIPPSITALVVICNDLNNILRDALTVSGSHGS